MNQQDESNSPQQPKTMNKENLDDNHEIDNSDLKKTSVDILEVDFISDQPLVLASKQED